MSITALEAAKFACEASGWTLTNLQLQKILYIAHMVHLGRTNQPLIEGDMFEAWDYGPVLPNVYRRVSSFGAGNIRNIFFSVRSLEYPWDSEEIDTLSDAVEQLKDVPPFKLVEMVHDHRGAWGQVYDPRYRNSDIPNALIAEEYRQRFR